MVCARHDAVSEADHPPRAVGSLYQVGMSRPLYRAGLSCHAGMCQDGVGRIRCVGTFNESAACDGDAMSRFGSAFRDKQVVPSVFLINMRTFGISASCAAPYLARGRELFSAHRVYFAQGDVIVGVAHHVAFPVLEVERRVDASLLQPYGVRPSAARVGGMHQKVSFSRNVGGYHVKCSFMITDGRGIDASPGIGSCQVDL